jgi:hypothetical protein
MKACREVVYSVEREMGLKPATACLEGMASSHFRLCFYNGYGFLLFQKRG